MTLRDLYSNLGLTKLLANQVATSDKNSNGLDLRDFDSAVLGFIVGASGDTLSGSVKVELEVEESDDDSTYTDVADEDLTNVVSGTNDGCVAVIDDAAEDDVLVFVGYRGTKRYIRGVVNLVGTHTNGVPVTVFGARGHAHLKPVNT